VNSEPACRQAGSEECIMMVKFPRIPLRYTSRSWRSLRLDRLTALPAGREIRNPKFEIRYPKLLLN
jgi:hypothetical protein